MNFNRLLRTKAPIEPPVSVEEVRRHLRLMDMTQDDYLVALVEAAADMIDGPHGIGVALREQSYAMRLDSLHGPVEIPVYPVRSIEKVEWIDRDGAEQSSTDIRLDKISNPARVFFDIAGDALDGSIALRFTAGYDEMPVDLRHAVLMLVGHLFENAEATSTVKLETVPLGVETILARYRVS